MGERRGGGGREVVGQGELGGGGEVGVDDREVGRGSGREVGEDGG